MKFGLRPVLWSLVVLAAVSPVVAAQGLPCSIQSCDKPAENAQPPKGGGDEAKPVDVPKVTPPKVDFLDSVGNFVRDTSSAVGSGAAAVGGTLAGAFLAIGAFFTGLLADLAAALASLRPRGMPVPAYAAVAGGTVGVAAAGAQFGSWYAWKKLFPLGLAIPGFSRIEKDELLENDRRSRIFELIKTNPGIHLSEIARELDFAWGTTLHHLRKLRQDRLVMFKSVGHHKSFFVNGSGLSEKQMEAMSLVKNGTLAHLAHFLEAHPRVSLKELSEGLGISPPLAAFHVRKLEKAGFVQKVRDGKSVRLSTTEAVPAGFFKNLAEAVPASVVPQPMEAAS